MRLVDLSLLASGQRVFTTITDQFDIGATVLTHYYIIYDLGEITAAETAAPGAELVVDTGNRAITEAGIIRWKAATVIGKKVYIGNTLSNVAGASTKPNQIMECITDGDGVIGADVFPSDGGHIIDVEYSDGDEIVALSTMVERLLCLKKMSVVLLSKDGQGGWSRELVSRQVGCCSQDSVVSFDDVIYWCDLTGIYSYDSRGLKLLNLEWLQDWKTLHTDAQKQAALGEVDRINKQYLVSVSVTVGGSTTNICYRYDLIDGVWMSDVFPDIPLKMAVDLDGTINFITATKLETINKAGSTDYDGAGYTASWESNKIYPLQDTVGHAHDVLLKGIAVQYDSGVAITATVTLDDSTSPTTFTLPVSTATTNHFATLYMPLSSVCKSYRVKFTATIAAGGAAVPIIKNMQHYFDEMSAGGDITAR
jgi:hypothetical protein